jgi:maleylacetate reductase
MDSNMSEFRLVTYAREIISGPGRTAQLAGAVEQFGWQRLMLCTSPSLTRAGQVEAVQTALGPKLVVIYDRTQPHVLDNQLAEALALAAANRPDAIIGLGGGSPIGMAKAVSMALEEQQTGRLPRSTFPTEQPLLPVIAIPTTYAGSEMTPVYGVTHHSNGTQRKITVRDARVAPKLVIYDPLLTLDLPPQVTASSGINALAHCIEALYSISRNPMATVAAVGGIQRITAALPDCTRDGADLEARTEMLVGSHLAALALASTAMGLHHGLCHVLGGSANVSHGIANSIILPHAMRFNLDATSPQLALVAGAMGIALSGQSDQAAAQAAIDRVSDFICQLGLPQHLQDAGVIHSQLPQLAQLALQSSAVQANPRPITDAAQIEAVLRAAW